ncbi:MAG: TonB family protein [Deltaproteobacteria bacterium]|nr:TonB family protein [Deltaproteobacteria bacterium]
MRTRRWILPLLASLVLHVALLWIVIRAVPMFAAAPPDRLSDPSVHLIDLTEAPNRIRPARAKAIGTENNATTQETVARLRDAGIASAIPARPRPPRAARPGAQAPASTPAAVPGSAGEATMPPAFAPPRLPATAVSARLGPGLAGALPEDYFPDYPHGGHTYVNVMKRPGVDYFVQLKRIFKMAWDPVPAIRAHAETAAIHRGVIKVVVGLGIDARGEMMELFVLRGSGMGGYDREALRTIRASAPFAAPPATLVAGDGQLRMSWTFIVYL